MITLEAIADELDARANADFADAALADDPVGDAYGEAARLLRDARSRVMDAMRVLERAGIEAA